MTCMGKQYQRTLETTCQECNEKFADGKKLTNHISAFHKLSALDYAIKHFYNGARPTCQACQQETRYVAFSFKKYCKDHSKLAMKEGGSLGGKADAWNKGKTKETDQRIASQAAHVAGSGNPFYGRHHTQDSIKKIKQKKMLGTSSLQERILLRSHEFKCLTPVDDYWSRQEQHLLFECKVCGERQKKTLQAFERGSRCYKCAPFSKSNWELEVYDYVRTICPDAVSGDRSALSPKEIDVYVPSKKFGIECHGLYWHSELRPDADVDPRKHLQKLELANEAGVRLVQIFNDEWREKQDLVKAMLAYRLGSFRERVKTWSTEVVRLSVDEYASFFESTHVSGSTPARVAWGLKDRDGRTVAALSLRIPRHGKKYHKCAEVARFSTLAGSSVPGGLSKLMSHAKKWAAQNGFKKIISYVDRRYGTGDGWIKSGFSQVGSTAPDYWYTDGFLRYDRFKFRAKDSKPERQVALESGVARIWGCGSLIVEMCLQD